MEQVLLLLEICGPIVAALCAGYFLQRFGFLAESLKKRCGSLVYLVVLPILLFSKIIQQDAAQLFVASLIVPVAISLLISVILTFILARYLAWPAQQRRTAVVSVIWGNTSYYGFPLARNAFGETGEVHLAVVNAVLTPFCVLVSILLLQGNFADQARPDESEAEIQRRSKKFRKAVILVAKALMNPVILACLLAMAISVFIGAQRPQDFSRTISALFSLVDIIGSIGLYAALILIGSSLALPLQTANSSLVWSSLFIKLLLSPLFVFAVIFFFYDMPPAEEVAVSMLFCAVPVGVTGALANREMLGDDSAMARMLVIGTLLSCVSIPILLAFFI